MLCGWVSVSAVAPSSHKEAGGPTTSRRQRLRSSPGSFSVDLDRRGIVGGTAPPAIMAVYHPFPDVIRLVPTPQIQENLLLAYWEYICLWRGIARQDRS